MTLSLGDRVRILASSGSAHVGELGTITRSPTAMLHRPGHRDFGVTLDIYPDEVIAYSPSEIELVAETRSLFIEIPLEDGEYPDGTDAIGLIDLLAERHDNIRTFIRKQIHP